MPEDSKTEFCSPGTPVSHALTRYVIQVGACALALALALTVLFPLALYACWLWKCLLWLYPQL